MHELATQSLTLFFSLAAFFTGLGKAGLGALAGLATPILIVPLPDPRLAVGLGTVLFVTGDIGATIYYARRARLGILLHLLPISALGMLAAFLLGKRIPTGPYLIIITALSALAFVMLLYSEWRKRHSRTANNWEGSPKQKKKKHKKQCKLKLALLLSCGVIAGVTTVLGNVSGIFMNLYLSALRLPKQGFVATMALFYFLVNSLKLVIYYFYWHSLDLSILAQVWDYAPWILLSLLLGLACGFVAVHKMSEGMFSFFVVLASLASFSLLLWHTVQHFGLV